MDCDGLATAAEISAAVKARSVSALEVVEAAIGRIERRDVSLNAFVYRGFDDARSRARDVDAQISRGEDPGVLAGVPTAQKDLFNFYPGWPSTFGGITPLKDFRLDMKTTFPARTEAAGAIVLGATNSPVAGFRATCDNPLFGPTRNPFDLSRNSGGSSGGSAAAVADGMVPVAGATDGGGSIRIPAAWCGIYGFQPSFGRVPLVMRPNAFAAANPFISEGPVSRTVEDAALVMSALAGPDRFDPYTVSDTVDWIGAIQKPVGGLKIGFTPNLGFPVNPEIAEQVSRSVRAFEAAGMIVEEIDITLPASHRELTDLWCRMIAGNMVPLFDGFKAQGLDILGDFRGSIPDELVHWMDIARMMTPADVNRDQVLRTQVYDMLQGLLARYDIIACPTTSCLPVPNGGNGNTMGPVKVAGEAINPLIGFCLTYFTNFCGNPAASLPAGMINGLPVGLQVIGRRMADADVLAVSAAFEAARPWRDAYAICAARRLA